ncbi:hypothetical protein D3C87_645620 [compost metagenome]
MDKKSQFNLVLNSVIQSTEDPTILKATFIIHDFEQSWNGQIISKEVALENIHTLKNKPIVAKYYPIIDGNPTTDALGTHEEHVSINRFGDQVVKMDTVPIGVIVSEGYLNTVDDKEVICVDAVLWAVRFNDVCNLLLEWHQRGIKIVSSVEYFYKNYTFRDGIEYIESPIIYDGHCVLNSEQRGEHERVLPAYDSSQLLSFNDLKQFNRLVAQAINQNENQEGESMFFKKVCELSHDDIRTKIYQVLDPTLPESTYSWIVDTYDDHFIVELNSDTEIKFYQYNYTKTETEVNIDFESKTEVIEERKWIATSQTQELQGQLNSAQEKIEELNVEISSLNSTVSAVTDDKNEIALKFEETSEKLVSLNALVEELKPFKEQVETEKYNQSLNEQTEFYAVKFSAVNGNEQFESEEVQNLIKTSLNQNEEGKEAKLQLNSILVDLVKPVDQSINSGFKESANSRGKLIDVDGDFESRYSY